MADSYLNIPVPTPTQNPVPSADIRDHVFGGAKIDEFVTSMGWTYTDRFGVQHYTIEGINYLAQQAMSAFGYVVLAGVTFTTGATINNPNEVLLNTADGEYYKWTGSFASGPKVVPPGSTPSSTGGVGPGLWIGVGDASLRALLASSGTGNGDSLIAVKQPVTGSVARTQHLYNADRVYITDLGAVSGSSSSSVETAVIAAIKAGKAIILPHGFEWRLSTTLVCPQNLMPDVLRVIITCPDGRAKITMDSAGLMLDQNNTYKFEKAFFENIDFVGADKQNTASQFMSAPEGRWCANFITQNCSWDGFHTNYRASLISTKHYNAKYYGCGDTGAVVYTDHWSISKFSAFNLNEWHKPIFSGRHGRIFQILGGFNNYIYEPWFERVETVASAMFVNQSHYNFQMIGPWLENFKSQFFMHFDGDGTENTQSDIIVIDGMHINNNWSLDPEHSGQASGFTALINRINPANPGNNYDTKFCFRNIYEHQSSVTGWALTRTGSTLNLATSIHELSNCRLRPGQPSLTDGMTLTGSLPDLRRHYRDLSSNKLDLVPGNFQIISGRNTTGSQKDLVFDNSGDSAYFRRNSVKLIEWTTNYFAPGTANAIQCGTTTRPWSGGFTQVAFTVTSDERHKTGITPIIQSDERLMSVDSKTEMDALLDAWGEVEFAMYQYISSVEEKGADRARWHFGVVAQRVVEALTRHGLQWDKYAFICYDEWGARDNQYDDNGNLMEPAREAGNKYGIRYEEALVLEASYIRRKLRQLEK